MGSEQERKCDHEKHVETPILDLCGVASERLDGFYEWGLGRWHIVAGEMIAQATGAHVTVLPQHGHQVHSW